MRFQCSGRVILLMFCQVLLPGIIAAQDIGPLIETTDHGKSWHPEGQGSRSSTPGRSSNTAPTPLTPAQLQQMETQRRMRLGGEQNEMGVACYKRGEWDAAIQDFQNALKNRPGDSIIQANLRSAEEQARTQRDAVEQQRQNEIKDARAEVDIRSNLSRLTVSLSKQGTDFDGRADSGNPARSLDFMTGAPGMQPSVKSVPVSVQSDPMVVNLSSATTTTVNQKRVTGSFAPASNAEPLQFMTGTPTAAQKTSTDDLLKAFNDPEFNDAMDNLLLAQAMGDKTAAEKEEKRLAEWNRKTLEKLDRVNPTAPLTLQDRAKELEAAHDRIRKKELAAFHEISGRSIQDMMAELAAMKERGLYKTGDDPELKEKSSPELHKAMQEAVQRVKLRVDNSMNAADREARTELQSEFRRIMEK
jgi:tetratricopeptide (TPR) repeat protein